MEIPMIDHEIVNYTFAVQHNPNCPSPWLVRLPGDSLFIDFKPYYSLVSDDITGDVLGFGKTFEEAADKALEEAEIHKTKRMNDLQNRIRS